MHPCDNTEALLRVLREPRRNQYFYGKRMDVQHFQMEQDYGKLKQWLLNRLTLGKGVLCGLAVSVDGARICVGPGVAIDGLGREIVVPQRACIDPLTQEGGCCAPCCDEHDATVGPTPPVPTTGGRTGAAGTPAVQPAVGPAAQPAVQPAGQPGAQPAAETGYFTLWLCYRECRTDYQPVLVSDCGTREQCAPGTVVESYCLKVSPGVPPLQGDPAWCAKLWPREVAQTQPQPEAQPQPQPAMAPTNLRPMPANLDNLQPIGVAQPGHADFSRLLSVSRGGTSAAATTDGTHHALPTRDEVLAAATSRRHLLCGLFSEACQPPEGDSCVPLAVMLLRDGKVAGLETCLVRPRVYSNAVLLDLILCLADKIDDCCHHGDTPPVTDTTMRVKSVEFLGGPNNSKVITAVKSPLDSTQVNVQGQGNAIRIKFTKPFDTGAHKPTTPGPNDPNWNSHNVLVIAEQAGPVITTHVVPPTSQYVPGTLTIEAPDTIRWDLASTPPFWSRQLKGWQKGGYKLAIFGDAVAASNLVEITDTAGKALDGEPAAPTAGSISGDGSPGGTFVAAFVVA